MLNHDHDDCIIDVHLNESERHGDNTEAEVGDGQVGDEHVPDKLLIGSILFGLPYRQAEGQSDIHILALSPGCAHLSLSQYCCQHQNVASDPN